MPKILKNFWKGGADDYVFKPASELMPEVQQPVRAQRADGDEAPAGESVPAAAETAPADDPVSFAKVQADAILADAREEAEAYKKEARLNFEEELEREREAARQEGYARGYSEGMANAVLEGKAKREEMALEQVQAVEAFLEAAARERDRLLLSEREEMAELALAVAEKVIRVSLRKSSDIILRMVEAATDTHRRCEWARIYVADCDVTGKALTIPELAAALGKISDRVRVIPMPNEESGTCIVELPDVILDASVSTQMGNIREVLAGTGYDKDD